MALSIFSSMSVFSKLSSLELEATLDFAIGS
jgi:hypothetical protein